MGKWFFGFLFLLFACNPEKHNVESGEDFIVKNNVYARHFIMKSSDSCYLLNVLNPWQSSENVNYTYRFYKEKSSISKGIHIPVKRVICFSTSHIT